MTIIADRYEPTGGMKAGGMSEAHLCDDVRLKRKVMLKTLQTKQEQRRLDDERKSLLKLRSNHVVQLLDVITMEYAGSTFPCLILEYIDGKDLSEGMFPVGVEYLGILWQIAKGLNEIHSQGIVHRDIKPDNIRRDKEGVIKIIDFGLSREVGVDNKTKASMGYLPYMAPELLVKGEIEFTTAADVFAFTVVALAISDAGLPAWCRTRVPQPVPPDLVASHLPTLDAGVQAILQLGLSTDPKQRPSMDEVIRAIEGVLLRDRHKARVVLAGKVSEIDSSHRTVRPTVSSQGKPVAQAEIEYDGNDFSIKSTVGSVFANNRLLKPGDRLPPSCVLAFKTLNNYYYATFDVSNPEYMI